MKNLLDLPETIQNSDDESMPLLVQWEIEEKQWYISYSDEGSSVNSTGKTLEEAISNIKKEVFDMYGETI